MPLRAIVHALAALCALLPAIAAARPQPPPPPARLAHLATGLCLAADDRGRGRGAGLELTECDGAADQLWTINGSGQVKNTVTQECLEPGEGRGRGTVGLGDCGQPDQRWQTVGRGERFSLRNQVGGLCLDVEGRRGSKPVLRACERDNEQTWVWKQPEPPKERALINGAQGLCLDVEGDRGHRGANVLLGRCDGKRDQQWHLNTRGEIVNMADGKCLEAADTDGAQGRNVGLWDCLGEKDQLWEPVARGHTFTLRNQARGMCLDVTGRDGKRGDNVLLWSCDGATDQTWTWGHTERPAPTPTPPPPPPPPPVQQASSTPQLIVNQVSRLCLDVEGRLGQKGANVVTGTCDGGRDQLWFLNRRGELVNAAQGQCLEAENVDGAPGRNVMLYDCLGQKDQLWDLVAAGNGFVLRNQARGMCLDIEGRGNARLWSCDNAGDQAWNWGTPVAVQQPVPHWPPAPPAPPPGPTAMEEDVFAKVLVGMQRASFAKDKVHAFQIGVSDQHLTCAQLARAVKLISFSGDRVKIVEFASRRVLDKQNREDVVGVFSFSGDQRKVRELLK